MIILRDTYILMVRSLREAMRQPFIELGNIFIPVFFFFVTIGSLQKVAGKAFGVDDWVGFQLPVALLQAVAVGTAGSGLVTDIQRGYFDKLALTPAPRISLILGRMAPFILLIVLTIGAIVALSGESETVVADNSVLHLKLDDASGNAPLDSSIAAQVVSFARIASDFIFKWSVL